MSMMYQFYHQNLIFKWDLSYIRMISRIMILCPFCAYLNGLSAWKPKLESYYHEHDEVPHGFKHMESSGGLLTEDYKVYPKDDSDMFDKTEMEIVDPITKNQLSFLTNKIICDVCMINLYCNESLIVTKQLDEKEKLFRVYMRMNKRT